MSSDDTEFVREHQALVRKHALRIKAELDLRTDVDDLIAFGWQGLIEARGRFDPTRGVKFEVYATYRLRGAILDGVRTMARLPHRAHQKRRAAEALDWMLEAKGEEHAAQVAAAAGKPDLESTLAEIDDVLSKISATFMLAAVGQDEERSKGTTPEEALLSEMDKRDLMLAVEALPEREGIVVRGLYFEGRTLDEIGEQLGISKSWASRIHTRALGLLRERLEP